MDRLSIVREIYHLLLSLLAAPPRRAGPPGWYEPLNEPMDFWPDDITAPGANDLPEHWADDRP